MKRKYATKVLLRKRVMKAKAQDRDGEGRQDGDSQPKNRRE